MKQGQNGAEPDRFDVAILGTGIAGTVLGAILARQGARVLMMEKAVHPRFAIGESTTPEGSMLTRILAERWEVPELANLGPFHRIRQNVASSVGLKRQFGFVYHREGAPQRPEEVTQSVIPDLPYGPESHMYRQDVDAYMLHTAIRYGATVRQGAAVAGVEIDGAGVRIETERGDACYARYVVDGTGMRSVLADKFDLREQPTRLRTHSRAIFTHLVGVKPYDDCVHPRGVHGMPRRWAEGTLHHIFEGGWMWVIPFDNYPGATNPLCSVGLNLNTRLYPKRSDVAPAREFAEFLARFPSVAEQFRDALPVRDWVGTDRVQYTSTTTVGDRFCLLSHAAGFVDALYSRGLINTFETVNALAERVLRALKDDDFSAERFRYVDTLQQALLDTNDRLVHSSYVAFSHFDLWNAWNRIWSLGIVLGAFRLARSHAKFLQTRDPAWVSALDEAPFPGTLAPHLEGFNTLFDAASDQVRAVEEGSVSAQEAARSIMAMLQDVDFAPPAFRIGDVSHRYLDFSPLRTMTGLFTWGKYRAPAAVRESFDYPMGPTLATGMDVVRSRRAQRPAAY